MTQSKLRTLGGLICWAVCQCLSPAVAQSQSAPSGEAVFKRRCAGCHEQTNPRIPPRQALEQMPASRILRALDFGAMMTVAYPMNREERQAVAAYLGTNAPSINFPQDRKSTRLNSSHM